MNNLLKTEDIQKTFEKVLKHVKSEQKLIPQKSMFPSSYSDTLKCYTTFQPIRDESLSMYNLILSKDEIDGKKPFQTDIMENFIDKNIVKKATSQGYLDFKRMVYGNKESLPLSLKLEIKHEGIVHICEPPGNWGKLPTGFVSFYKGGAKAYITKDITSYDNFKFDMNKSEEKKNYRFKKRVTICMCRSRGKVYTG